MLRWVWRGIISLIVTTTILILLCPWTSLLEGKGGRLLLLDQDQKYKELEEQQRAEVMKHQVLKSRSGVMESRSKFQKDQVEKYCAIYGNRLYKLPERKTSLENLYRHLLFDDSRKSIFCFMEKAGCTNMQRLMFVSAGHLPVNSSQDDWVDLKYLERGIRHGSFLNKSLSDDGRMKRLRDYFKFTVIRNPLERLVSSYRNKIEPPLLGLSQKFPHYIKRQIFEQYRPMVYQYWLERGGNYNISITFSEFVEYYIDSFKPNLNPHIRPFSELCHPCSIPYDFYAHFSDYSHDIRMAIKRVGMNRNHFHDKSLYLSKKASTALVMREYYLRLTHTQRARLYDSMRDELLFYYYLYPSEHNSHISLLGIEEQLYVPYQKHHSFI